MVKENQVSKFVGFTSYNCNHARGGGFGLTFYRHAVKLVLACNHPLGIRGELRAALTWVDALDGVG